MVKNRAFSLYDIEEILHEAGAEKVNERAVVNLEQELENTVKELIDEVQACANYAGRERRIESSDVMVARELGPKGARAFAGAIKPKKRITQASRNKTIFDNALAALTEAQPL